MITVIIGGSGSGKSEYAEQLVVQSEKQKRYYVATMIPFDQECEKKIERHRQMRSKKGFETKECYIAVSKVEVEQGSILLLECLSNLVANEMFGEEGYGSLTANKVVEDLRALSKKVDHLVIVTNDIFGDGVRYEGEMNEYLTNLAVINRQAAFMADQVIEVVCGIPIVQKGEKIV